MVKKFFFRLLLLAAIMLPLMYLAAGFYDKLLQKNKKDKGTWLVTQHNTHYNLGFIGSSRVYNFISIKKIDSALAPLKGINMGIGGAAYCENLLVLTIFLNNNNTLDYLVIQTDMWGLITPEKAYSHPFNDQNYLYLIGDRSVDSVFSANTNPLKHIFRKYIPFFKYAEYNNKFPLNEIYSMLPGTSEGYDTTMGSKLVSEKKEEERFKGKDGVPYRSVDPKSFGNLKALVRTAKTHGIRVIFFTSPTKTSYLAHEPSNEILKDSISVYAKANGIPYFDFEKHPICKEENLFINATHLEAGGAKYFSVIFSDSLKKVILKNRFN